LAQKLIARAAGRDRVSPGEIVNCRVDLAMFHDSSGPRRLKPMLDELKAPIWDTSRVVLVMDHYVPERDDESRRIVKIARDWAREQALPYVYDGQGICHVVVPQGGHIRPGLFCVGGDSHSPTGGAFGAYMFGIGSTEMLGVVVTGEIWLRVPQTIQMVWRGRLASGVCAKDMMLHMIGRFGMNGGQYQAIEFAGDTVQALGMQERMTLSNMSAELGSQVGLIAPDATTRDWLRATGAEVGDTDHWRTDDGAALTRHDFDASTLAPQVAAPHSPANAGDVTRWAGLPVDVAYIGAPASQHDQRLAEQEGVMQVLRDAGAEIGATACGACAGYGDALGGASTVISTTARNFKGRMGSAEAQVYLASPYTVAASAITGRISDPRAFAAVLDTAGVSP
jgi:3-isopropylmalate/(R)-2-methylmalate dehydratase large subunit